MKRRTRFAIICGAIACVLVAISALTIKASAETKKAAKQNEYPSSVNIGIIEGGPESAILAKEGYLQKYIKTKVNVTTYSAGTDINNAFIAKDVDIAAFGSTPVTLGLVNGVSYKAIGTVYNEGGSIEALVARNGTGIKSVADLKGKTIAVPFGTTSHYALLQALKLAGLSTKDVTLMNLSGQNIVAAWKRGEVDAAYTWSPSLTEIMKTGTVITNDGQLAAKGITMPEVAVATDSMISKYPKVVKQYMQAILAVEKLVRDNPAKAIADVASWEGITKAAAKTQIEDNNWLSGSTQLSSMTGSSSDFAKTLQLTAQFQKSQENITTVPTISSLSSDVDTTALKSALKEESK